jgi:Arc/MetJ family transcription regulator
MNTLNPNDLVEAARRAAVLRKASRQACDLALRNAVKQLSRQMTQEEIAAETGLTLTQVEAQLRSDISFPAPGNATARGIFDQIHHEVWSHVDSPAVHLNNENWRMEHPSLGLFARTSRGVRE